MPSFGVQDVESTGISKGYLPASTDSMTQTMAVSKATPGTLVTGATTGQTPSGQGLAPVDTQIQAYTNPNTGSLSSQDADNYLAAKKKELTDASLKAANLISPNVVGSDAWKEANYNTDGTPKSQTTDALSDLQRTQTNANNDFQANLQRAYEINKKKVEEDIKNPQARMDEKLASEAATARVGVYHLGQADTKNYGPNFIAGIKREHERQREDFGKKVQDLMGEAWNSALRGSIRDVEGIQKGINTEITARKQAEADELDTLKKVQDLEEKRLKNMGDARDFLSDTASTWAKAGYEPTEAELDYFDGLSGATPGAAGLIAKAARNEQEKLNIKDADERQSRDWTTAKLMMDAFDKMGVGADMEIDGMQYFYQGVDTTGMKSGVEIDKNTGQGTYWQVNPRTKQIDTVPMGYMTGGSGWSTEMDDAGNMWRVNPNTKQIELMTPSEGKKEITQVFPPGSVSPFRNAAGQPRTECGMWVNDICGAGVGDSFESKMAKTDKSIKPGSENPPRYGDFFVQSLNTETGHTGMVLGYFEKDGKGFIETSESNYPQSGKINYRTVPVEQINGFGRTGSVNPAFKTGPDSSGFGVFGAKGATAETNKPLTAGEAKTWREQGYDVKPGMTIQDVQGLEKTLETKGNEDVSDQYQAERATRVMDAADNVYELVNDKTTGFASIIQSKIPGTQAFDLAQRIQTLKANIGFNELQAMRAASPTGGALGQVAVQELEALQSVLGSLDQGQSPSELKKNLKKVNEHIVKWQNNQKQFYNKGGSEQQDKESANNDPLGIL